MTTDTAGSASARDADSARPAATPMTDRPQGSRRPPRPPSADQADRRRNVPRTDAVLADPRLVDAAGRLGPAIVKAAVVAAQNRARRGDIGIEAVADVAVATLPATAATSRPVINATGVVVHTNLGRAALSAAAVDALVAAAGHTDVELDLVTGSRTRRGRGALDALAAAVPAAEAVHVANNGAAALLLAATAMAAGREIVVSRGELVEIGDGFRLPDLLQSTGATLREVGTTNRTTLRDYAAALGPQTGFVLKVHPSNFRISGFTSAVTTRELATLDAPVVFDIGSGLLTPEQLLPDEPDATTALRDGAALVTASGDKLLGGPQAGLLLGRADIVERLRRHPMARALRVDKLTLAALEATLRGPASPTALSLHASVNDLQRRADLVAAALVDQGVPATAAETRSVVGGGGAPGLELESWGVALDAVLAAPLRVGSPSVMGRIERDRLLLDLRCVPAAKDDAIIAAVVAVSRSVEH